MITGREPIIERDTQAWHYVEPGSTGRVMTYTMGEMNGVPTMALFIGDENRPIFVPVPIMLHCTDWAEEKGQLQLSHNLYHQILDQWHLDKNQQWHLEEEEK